MELLIIIAILAAPAIIPGFAHLCFKLILSKESQKQSSPLQEDDNLGFKITAMILLSIPLIGSIILTETSMYNKEGVLIVWALIIISIGFFVNGILSFIYYDFLLTTQSNLKAALILATPFLPYLPLLPIFPLFYITIPVLIIHAFMQYELYYKRSKLRQNNDKP
ncbi:hypothetical protein [Fibrobacter sp.]|uniref:hypothetical protein n=1 Tax=Fibrobacter sp. TaxID=35828 RepID=UPI0025B86072|nr:hypothetical protein [Fibrobacter sp.]MBR3073490.1 hypothetical protein [Fibrobacter sp.]